MMEKPLLLFSESVHNADMFYATRFLSSDPFIYLRADSELIVVPHMEVERARRETKFSEVRSFLEYGGNRDEIDVIILELLRDKGVNEVCVPGYFPVFIADKLREKGISVEVAEDVMAEREIKRYEEVVMMKKAQRACEYAMDIAIKKIKSCRIRDVLIEESGDALTAEKLKVIIEHALIDCGCVAEEEPIVACGRGSANPHWTGSGEIVADEPIIIDIFPRLRRERYYADMTRTVVRGEPSAAVEEMFETVRYAQDAAVSSVRAGVSCADVHNLVCDIFEERGYDTLRRFHGNESEERRDLKEVRRGFLHATGHGIGLSLHEKPSVSDNDYVLQAGNVITIEPGLYDPDIGGVRLEDMILVRDKTCENLTKFAKTLIV
ncbi:MAG: Xaa-Pro peptidase family protein [Canidatus Methanoxibalbensis ujae]|nr:Xaa-Pro peptidase family protein [Candidatus Methanoxibalbensis ujae]MCW7078147.1 Xaa-Pro peptidase family protein [Candidatus Methanoxibalbensis ujae]